MRVRAGTSGFSYPEWKGNFYPEAIKPAQMLEFYSGRFTTVEINNTFYRMPRESVLAGWAAQVPEDFAFVLKASRRITHQKRLRDAAGELDYLVRSSAALGSRLGPTLFQLPPYLKKDSALLRDFVALFPRGWRAALEFRQASWFDDETYGILHEANVALVVADADSGASPAIAATADFGYLRLRRPNYDEADLAGWAGRVLEQPWGEAYVFFKHEDAGAGPAMAQQFARCVAGTPP